MLDQLATEKRNPVRIAEGCATGADSHSLEKCLEMTTLSSVAGTRH